MDLAAEIKWCWLWIARKSHYSLSREWNDNLRGRPFAQMQSYIDICTYIFWSLVSVSYAKSLVGLRYKNGWKDEVFAVIKFVILYHLKKTISRSKYMLPNLGIHPNMIS